MQWPTSARSREEKSSPQVSQPATPLTCVSAVGLLFPNQAQAVRSNSRDDVPAVVPSYAAPDQPPWRVAGARARLSQKYSREVDALSRATSDPPTHSPADGKSSLEYEEEATSFSQVLFLMRFIAPKSWRRMRIHLANRCRWTR